MLGALLVAVQPDVPAEFIDDVKVIFNVVTCQGESLPETLDAKAVAAYWARQKPRMTRFIELVYPFGGGDMMMALNSFSEAKVITTMSLELAGDPRRFKSVKDPAVLKQSLNGLLMTSSTTLLANDSKSVNLSSISAR